MDSLNQLLNGSLDTSTATSNISDQLNQLMIWTIVPTIIFGIIFLVFYSLRVVRRRKVENAIFEIRDLLKDMQMQQKPIKPAEQTLPPEPPTTPPKSENIYIILPCLVLGIGYWEKG